MDSEPIEIMASGSCQIDPSIKVGAGRVARVGGRGACGRAACETIAAAS